MNNSLKRGSDTTKAQTIIKSKLQAFREREEQRKTNENLIRDLRGTISRLERTLARQRDHDAAVVDAVGRAISEAASGLVIPMVPKPRTKRRGDGTPEQAILFVSDLQLAKRTPTYDVATCEKRMETYLAKAVKIIQIQRADHPVDIARVYLGGDILEGELIFPHQASLIESGLFTQLMVHAPRILINFIRGLLAEVAHVHMVCVPGNHGELGGRQRRDYNPETNADRMLYAMLQATLAGEPRLTWQVVYGANHEGWYAVDYPFAPDRSHGNLIIHGQQIPNPASASSATVARKILGWATGAIPEPFETVFYAHHHNPKYIPFNRYKVIGNGSTESTNIYAQKDFAAMGQPVQFMCFTHPRRGITGHHWIELEDSPIISWTPYELPPAKVYAPVARRTARG